MEGRFDREGKALGKPRRPVGQRPTPKEFRAFVLLAEELHFGRAARRLGTAQSSLSETIRRLEAKLDVVLFERTSRRVGLTEAGAGLLPIAREVLDSLEAVRTAIVPDLASAGEMLRVGIEGQGFAELTRPILGGLRARHPGASLLVREAIGDAQAIIDGRFDVALLRSPIEDDRLSVHPVATEERGILVPEGHPAAGAEGLSATEFLDEPFVELVPQQPRTCAHWHGGELRGGERPNVGGSVCGTQDAVNAIAYLGLLTTGNPSAVRSFPLAPMGYVGTTDLAPEVLSVAVRSDDERPFIRDFVETVRVLVAEFAEDVPGVALVGGPQAP